jgi:hypothetical protein
MLKIFRWSLLTTEVTENTEIGEKVWGLGEKELFLIILCVLGVLCVLIEC